MVLEDKARSESRAGQSEEGRARSSWRMGWLAAALIGFGIYLPALQFESTLDDSEIIVNNTRIVDLRDPAAYLWTSWWGQPGLHKEYRPATMATFALNRALFGLNFFAFHLVNNMFHAVNAALVWWLIWLLAQGYARRHWMALAGAVLFAIHPVHVEAVAGIVGRAELMMTFGLLLALISGLKAWNSSSARRYWVWVLIGGVAAGLSVFSKEQGVVIPVALALLALSAPMAGGDPAPSRRLRRAAPAIGLSLAFVVLYLVARQQVLGSMFRPEDSPIHPFTNPLLYLNEQPRMLAKLALFAKTWGILLLPLWPSPDYSYRAIDPFALAGGGLWLAGAAVLFAGIAGFFASIKRPPIFCGLLLLLVPLPLYTNLFIIMGTFLGERLLYLPSVGLCMLAAALLNARLRGAPLFRVAAALLAVWGSVLLAQHFRYLPHWRNNLSILKYAVTHWPECGNMHFGYGLELRKAGDLDGAIRHLDEMMRIIPEGSSVPGWRAVVLAELGRDEEALRALEAAHQQDPTWHIGNEAYANLLTRLGEVDKAEAVLEEAVAADPEHAESRELLERWRAANGRAAK